MPETDLTARWRPGPTERLRFREMVPGDLDALAAVLGAPYPHRPGVPRRSREETVAWIDWNRRSYADHGFGLWAVETHDGAFVGDCGLTVQDVEGTPTVEVGYHVGEDLRRTGLATEAASAVRDAARAAGLPHLVAIIRPDNLASQGVARAIGLSLEREIHAHGGPALLFGADLG